MSQPTFTDYMNIVRPFIYKPDNSDHPFWGQGSCFLVRSSDRYYIVSAGHVIDKESLGYINIPASEPDLQHLPINRHFAPNSTEIEDTDFLDIEVLEVDAKKATESGISISNFVHLPEFAENPHTLDDGQKLVAIGIPSPDLSFDYEEKLVHYKRFACDGIYAGKSSYRGCHTMQIAQEQPDHLASLDGFSGGPVVAWRDTGKNTARLKLVGIALRGTTSSRAITFIGSDCLLELLARIQ